MTFGLETIGVGEVNQVHTWTDSMGEFIRSAGSANDSSLIGTAIARRLIGLVESKAKKGLTVYSLLLIKAIPIRETSSSKTSAKVAKLLCF